MISKSEVWFALLGGICVATCVELDTEGYSDASPQSHKRLPVLVRPVQPKTPMCSQNFPGTPGWNECFQKYMKDMADFQAQMHEYAKNVPKNEGGSSNFQGGSSYSNSFSSSSSTSNSYVGGYAITAMNMGLFTSMTNGILKVTFNIGGPVDSFEKKTVGNEIQFRVVSKGQQKLARITVPKGVQVEDVKIDKTADAIYLTAPASVGGGGNGYTSQSSSSGTGFNQNFQLPNTAGQMPVVPVVPMPDLQNMFQNMFQNFLPNLFAGINGGRSFPMQKPKESQPASYYPIPGVWFF